MNRKIKYIVLLAIISMLIIVASIANPLLKNNYALAFEAEEDDDNPKIVQSNGYTYGELADGNIILYSYVGEDVEKISVPGEIDGKKIEEIGEACFCFLSNTKEIIFESSIQSLDRYLFTDDPVLEKICFKDDVKDIDEDAFAYYENKVYAFEGTNIYKFCERKDIKISPMTK